MRQKHILTGEYYAIINISGHVISHNFPRIKPKQSSYALKDFLRAICMDLPCYQRNFQRLVSQCHEVLQDRHRGCEVTLDLAEKNNQYNAKVFLETLHGQDQAYILRFQLKRRLDRPTTKSTPPISWFDTPNLLVLGISNQLQLTFANDSFYRVIQIPNQQELPLEKLFEKSAMDSIMAKVSELKDTGEHQKVQFVLKDHQRRVRWYEFIVMPNSHTNFISGDLLFLGYDISGFKKMESQLREHKRKLLQAQSIAKIGSLEVNPGDESTRWSPELYDMLNLKAGQVPATFEGFVDLIHPEDVNKFLNHYYFSLKSNDIVHTEFRLMSPAHEEVRYVKASSKAIEEENRAVLITIYDVTEQKRKEMALDNAMRKAKIAGHAKAQFLSTMSHEVRNPLGAIIGLTKLLLEDNPRYDQIERLSSLANTSKGLMALLNDILDFNKLESGRVELEHIDFDLCEELDMIRKIYCPQAIDKGIKFHYEKSDSLPYVVKGDPHRLKQILTNLLSNALKFTEQGQIELLVTLLDEREDDFLIKFEINDTGIGIDKSRLNQIFDQYQQADATVSRKFGGTGLGLNITKSLLDMMGSRIHVDSEAGKGTRFTFTLALRRGDPATFYASRKLKKENEMNMQGLRVLLAEDSPVNKMVLTQFLEKWNCKVTATENGEEAVTWIANADFDLVLMDLRMPRLDGLEATRIIRESFEVNIPVIAVTADSSPDIKAKVIEAGMNDIITKPFDPADLFSKITNLVKISDRMPQQTPSPEEHDKPTALFTFADVKELLGPENEFLQEFVQLNVDGLEELKTSYQDAVNRKHLQDFRDAAHKIKPTLHLLKFHKLEEEIKIGRAYLEMEEPPEEKLAENAEEVTALCDIAIAQMHDMASGKIEIS